MSPAGIKHVNTPMQVDLPTCMLKAQRILFNVPDDDWYGIPDVHERDGHHHDDQQGLQTGQMMPRW